MLRLGYSSVWKIKYAVIDMLQVGLCVCSLLKALKKYCAVDAVKEVKDGVNRSMTYCLRRLRFLVVIAELQQQLCAHHAIYGNH